MSDEPMNGCEMCALYRRIEQLTHERDRYKDIARTYYFQAQRYMTGSEPTYAERRRAEQDVKLFEELPIG